jgi:hypothetical protein
VRCAEPLKPQNRQLPDVVLARWTLGEDDGDCGQDCDARFGFMPVPGAESDPSPPPEPEPDCPPDHLCSPRFAGDPILEACFEDRARLTIGARGDSVARVQQALIDLGYDLGVSGADGIYGQATWRSVKLFKSTERLGWEWMGDVGPGTMHRLDALFSDEQSDARPTRGATLAFEIPAANAPGPTDPALPPMPTPFVFTPGSNHDHRPTGKWADIQAHPQSGVSIEGVVVGEVCRWHSPAETIGIAIKAQLKDKPKARAHIAHYLFTGSGADFNEDQTLDHLLRTSSDFQTLVRGYLPNRVPPKRWHQWHFPTGQGGYGDIDIVYSWGGVDRFDLLVDYGAGLLHLWFKDRYEWHPVYDGIYTKFSDDVWRPSNCVHAALVEMKLGGWQPNGIARDYWMVGKATVPLSLISKSGTSNG